MGDVKNDHIMDGNVVFVGELADGEPTSRRGEVAQMAAGNQDAVVLEQGALESGLEDDGVRLEGTEEEGGGNEDVGPGSRNSTSSLRNTTGEVLVSDTGDENAISATNTSIYDKDKSCGRDMRMGFLVFGGVAVLVGAVVRLWRRHVLCSRDSGRHAGTRSKVGRLVGGYKKNYVYAHNVYLDSPSVKVNGIEQETEKKNMLTFVVSDRMNVAGCTNTPGQMVENNLMMTDKNQTVPKENGDRLELHRHRHVDASVCSVSATAVDLAIQHGGVCKGITRSLRYIQKGTDNRTKKCWHGAGDYGACIAVANKDCDFALTVDDVGSTMVPAACSELMAYRPTSGLFYSDGITQFCPTLSTVCVVAREGKMIRQVAQMFDVPKIAVKDHVERYLVAEDLFKLCGNSMTAAMPAVIAAVKRWAGAEHAQALSLCEWMFNRIPKLKVFLSSESGAKAPSTQDIIQALGNAAYTILLEEIGAIPAGWDGFVAGDYNHAIQVAEGLSVACRNAMQDGLVFIIPTIPNLPPEIHGDMKEIAEFESRCRQFASVAALAGIPQVTVPLNVKDSGSLSISLLTLQRKDESLFRSIDKIKQFLVEEIARLNSKSQLHGRENIAAEKAKTQENSSRAEADKEEGNTFFRNKKYNEAIRCYTRAISRSPRIPIYYSNRAMAYLKLGEYQEAEDDCTKALEIDSSLVKALLRRAAARVAMANFDLAKGDLQRVLLLEPKNVQAHQELRDLKVLCGD